MSEEKAPTADCQICYCTYSTYAGIECGTCKYKLCSRCAFELRQCPMRCAPFDMEAKRTVTSGDLMKIAHENYNLGKQAVEDGGPALAKARSSNIMLRGEIGKVYDANTELEVDNRSLRLKIAIMRDQILRQEHMIEKERAFLHEKHYIAMLDLDRKHSNIVLFEQERRAELNKKHDMAINDLQRKHDAECSSIKSEATRAFFKLRSECDASNATLGFELATALDKLRALRSEQSRDKLIIIRLVRPVGGPKSKMCRHFNPTTNSAEGCQCGKHCKFAHSWDDLLHD